MNLKDIVDKLASIDKLEKMSSQLDQKIPGQQTNLDPKADVTAMTQALAAVRGPAMSPNAAVAAPQSAQPAQTMTTEPPQQDAPPPERRELQQKNRPGEPMGEELIGEQEVPAEEFIKKAIERVNDNPELFWRLPPELRDTVRSSMTPEAQNVADTQKAYVDATTRDPKNTKLQQDLLADIERAKSAHKPNQARSSAPPAEAPKPKEDKPSQSASSQEEIDAQQKLTQQLGQAYQQVMQPDSGQSEVGKAAVRKSYEEAAAKLDAMKGTVKPTAEPAQTTAAANKPPAPKANLGSGDWYRGKEGDYTIQKGDTLSSISKKTGVPLSQLMRDNNIQNPNKIVAGAKLKTGQDTAQAGAASSRQEFGLAPGASDAAGTNATAPAGFSFTPEQEKWLGNANRQDPNILSRMPGPKPPLSYFTNPEDQARARELNQGNQNLTRVKNAFGGKNKYDDVFPDVQQPAPANPDQKSADAEIDRVTTDLAQADEKTRNAQLQAELDKQNAANNKPAAAPTAPTADDLRQRAASGDAAARSTISQQQIDATAKPEKPPAAEPATKENIISLKSIVDELLNRN